jgi:hypothetical protein
VFGEAAGATGSEGDARRPRIRKRINESFQPTTIRSFVPTFVDGPPHGPSPAHCAHCCPGTERWRTYGFWRCSWCSRPVGLQALKAIVTPADALLKTKQRKFVT